MKSHPLQPAEVSRESSNITRGAAHKEGTDQKTGKVMVLQQSKTLIGNPPGKVPGKLSLRANGRNAQLTMKAPCQHPEKVSGM